MESCDIERLVLLFPLYYIEFYKQMVMGLSSARSEDEGTSVCIHNYFSFNIIVYYCAGVRQSLASGLNKLEKVTCGLQMDRMGLFHEEKRQMGYKRNNNLGVSSRGKSNWPIYATGKNTLKSIRHINLKHLAALYKAIYSTFQQNIYYTHCTRHPK